MLGQCRAANLLLHIRLCMASAQLALCPHGTHVADLLPIARSASGSASPSAPSEQPQCAVTSTEELTYFDEPLELELSLTSVPRPAAADADPNTHPKADPRPHSLADLADVGANVQQQVDRSLEQVSMGAWRAQPSSTLLSCNSLVAPQLHMLCASCHAHIKFNRVNGPGQLPSLTRISCNAD